MAFHLHRLGLVGRALRNAGYNVHDAADLTAGRTVLSSVGATGLAERLGIAVQQLSRELSEDERRAWSFYRRAAAAPQHVWSSARRTWHLANLSDQEAATIMGIDKTSIAQALSKPSRRVLSFEHAARLTTALNILEGPEVFLPTPKNNDPQQSR